MLENENKTNIIVKSFEVSITWILALCFIMGIVVLGKGLDFSYKIYKTVNPDFGFVDLVLRISKYSKDLADIQNILIVYRILVIVSCLVFAFFIVYRIVKKEVYKLVQFSSVLSLATLIFSCCLLYITKEIFPVLEILIDKAYATGGLSEQVYLMDKMQKLKETRYLATIVFVTLLVLTLITLIVNVYELTLKTDVVLHPGLNSGFFVLVILGFIAFIYTGNRVKNHAYDIQLKNYFVMGFDINDKGEISPKAYVNSRKVDKKYLDILVREFMNKKLSFELSDTKPLDEKVRLLTVKGEYSKENAKIAGVTIKNPVINIKLEEKPRVVTNIKELNMKSLKKYLKKYDARYTLRVKDESDENCGIYYGIDKNNRLDFFVVQRMLNDFVPVKYKYMIGDSSKFSYEIIYLGDVFVNSKGDVLCYTRLNNESNMEYTQDLSAFKEYIKNNKFQKYK